MKPEELAAYAGKTIVVKTANATNYFGRVAQHNNLGVRLVQAQQIRNGRFIQAAKRVISPAAIVGAAEANEANALAAAEALNAQLKAAATAPAQGVAKTA